MFTDYDVYGEDNDDQPLDLGIENEESSIKIKTKKLKGGEHKQGDKKDNKPIEAFILGDETAYTELQLRVKEQPEESEEKENFINFGQEQEVGKVTIAVEKQMAIRETNSPKLNSNATDYGEEGKQSEIKIGHENIPARDLFRLSKHILLGIVVLYVLSAAAFVGLDENKNAANVWEFSKVFLSSISTLVLGYYFGKKDK